MFLKTIKLSNTIKCIMKAIFGEENCCRKSSISLVASDGQSVTVNKYFLLIYDDFFKSLMTEMSSDDVTIFFDDISFQDLLVFQTNVHEKHFKCKITVEDHKEHTDTTKNGSKEKGKSDSSGDKVNILVTDNKELTEDLHQKSPMEEVKCPFNCMNNYKDWTEDTIYAHIVIDHHEDVLNNYQLAVDRFIKNLCKRISVNKCALNSDCRFTIKNANSDRLLKGCQRSKGIHELKNHYRQVHAKDPSICNNCGAEFKNTSNLRNHLRHASCNNKDEQCQDCGKFVKGSHNLNRHIQRVHLQKGRKLCTICDQTFGDSESLKQHNINVHEKLKNWICDICGTKMSQFGNLNDHRLKVHGEKFPSIMNYRNIISSGRHPFVVNKEEALQAKVH